MWEEYARNGHADFLREVALYLTARGLTTGPIPWRQESFDIEFDFIDHRFVMRLSDGRSRELPLAPMSVAEFYRQFMDALRGLGIEVTINTLPSEVPHPIRFQQDTEHASYDGVDVQRWWRIMLGVERAMERYRAPFTGKNSPVNFFWGGSDLSQTRFSTKPCTPPTSSPMMEFGEDQENFAVGFWPGSDQSPAPALYAYMHPAPAGVESAKIQSDTAQWAAALGEFVLLYDTARQAPDPAKAIEIFFQSTYEACAKLAGWDRAALERHVPEGWEPARTALPAVADAVHSPAESS